MVCALVWTRAQLARYKGFGFRGLGLRAQGLNLPSPPEAPPFLGYRFMIDVPINGYYKMLFFFGGGG